MIVYGVIRNVSGGKTIRLISGTLLWQFQPANGGSTITASTTLTNINDQFSYLLRGPVRNSFGGSHAFIKCAALGARSNGL